MKILSKDDYDNISINKLSGYFKDTLGNISWFQNGKLHRDNKPAVELDAGAQIWYLHGKLHRIDGPAIIATNGDKFWYQNNKLHRIDGPAVEFSNGNIQF